MTQEKSDVLSYAQAKKAEELSGTPCVIFDAKGIMDEIAALNAAFSWQSGYCNYVPIRDIPNKELLIWLKQTGCGVLAIGKGELLLANMCGFCGEKLLYQPVSKDYEAAELAQQLSAAWLAVSIELLPPLTVRQVLLRCFPDKEYLKPLRHIKTTGLKDGMDFRHLTQAVQTLMARGYGEVGLELQLKPYDLHPGFYSGKAEVLLSIAKDLQKHTGIIVSECNLGDSPGHDYRADRRPIDISETAYAIERLKQGCAPEISPTIRTALGRQVLQKHGFLLTKVQEIRRTEKRYLILNASVAQCLRIAVQKTEHGISLLYPKSRKERPPMLYAVAGQQPELFDRFSGSCVLPEAQVGDYCLIHEMGCGSISMPSVYGVSAICPVCLKREDDAIALLTKGHSQEEVLNFLTAW